MLKSIKTLLSLLGPGRRKARLSRLAAEREVHAAITRVRDLLLDGLRAARNESHVTAATASRRA